jgi:hypothetical protein
MSGNVFKGCSTCAHCVKSRRGWKCKKGHDTKGGRWTARCGEWEGVEKRREKDDA